MLTNAAGQLVVVVGALFGISQAVALMRSKPYWRECALYAVTWMAHVAVFYSFAFLRLIVFDASTIPDDIMRWWLRVVCLHGSLMFALEFRKWRRGF